MDIVLETRGLSKQFKGFTAVRGVDLKVRRGSIHALIGPNGAGKTTCFNLVTKFLVPSAGSILLNGKDITRSGPADVARMGMARSFQISAIFPHMSVLENVRMALLRATGTSFAFWRPVRALDALNGRALALLEDVGLAALAGTMAAELSYGRKRALEIATTLALDPQVLLLDEPMAGMSSEDIDRTVELIRRVGRNRTILMVEHNLKVVANLSDTITVLKHGQILAEGDYESVSNDPAVVEAYMGVPNA